MRPDSSMHQFASCWGLPSSWIVASLVLALTTSCRSDDVGPAADTHAEAGTDAGAPAPAPAPAALDPSRVARLESLAGETVKGLPLKSGAPSEELVQRVRDRIRAALWSEQRVQQEAAERGVSVARLEVTRAISEVAEELGGQAKLSKRLERFPGGMPELRAAWKTQLLAERLAQPPPVSRGQAADDLQRRGGDVAAEPRWDLQRILIAVAPDAPEADVVAARATAIEIATRARAAGASFSALARARSAGPLAKLGGALPRRRAADLHEAVRAALTGMAPGDVSDPIRTSDGFEIVKLLRTHPAEPSGHRASVLRATRRLERRRRQDAVRQKLLELGAPAIEPAANRGSSLSGQLSPGEPPAGAAPGPGPGPGRLVP